MILSRQNCWRTMLAIVGAQYSLGAVAYIVPGLDTFNMFKAGVLIGHWLAVGVSAITLSPIWWHEMLRTGLVWLMSGLALVPLMALAYERAAGGPLAVGFLPLSAVVVFGGLSLIVPLSIQSMLHFLRGGRRLIDD